MVQEGWFSLHLEVWNFFSLFIMNIQKIIQDFHIDFGDLESANQTLSD